MYQIITTIKNLPKRTKIALIVAIVAVLLLIIVFTLLGSRYGNLRITSINATFDNNVHLVRDKLKITNGIGFYEIDPLKDSAPRVIYTLPYRLPEINNITWAGDNGAMLTFEDNGFDETPVLEFMNRNSISRFSENNQTWYLDFKTNEITKINDRPMSEETSYYSPTDKKIYYYIYDDVTNPVIAFDIEDKSTKIVSTKDRFDSISSIVACGQLTCFIGTEPGKQDQSLVRIKPNELQNLTSGELIRPVTNNKDFIVLNDRLDFDNDVITEYGVAGVYDTESSSLSSTKGTFASENLGAGASGDHVYLLNQAEDSYSSFTWQGVRNSQLITYDNSSIDGVIPVSALNKSNEKLTLLSSFQRDFYLVADRGVIKNSFNKPSLDSPIINACLNQHQATIDLVDTDNIIYIPLAADFSQKISQLNKCLNEQPSITAMYTFKYQGVDPVNGRIVTD